METNAIMKSINFEFLRSYSPVLADLGGFAEAYAHNDPTGALVKVRMILEETVETLYADLKLAKPYASAMNKDLHLDELIDGQEFVKAVPPSIRHELHALRKLTNPGAHIKGIYKVKEADALGAIRRVHGVTHWLAVARKWTKTDALPVWSGFEPGGASEFTKSRLQEEKKAALVKLSEAELKLQALRSEVEAARAKARDAASKTALSEEQLAKLLEATQNAADLLKFDEARTRRALVDQMLTEAGWRLDGDGTEGESVAQEIELKGALDDGKTGIADYVLYSSNGDALAVIEVKRTAIDPEAGIAQAERYAEALAKQQKGVLPVIFATNGIETTLWDRALGETPRRVYGFPSPDSLVWRVQQRTARKALSHVLTDTSIVERDYQLEAIQRICERYESHRRKALAVLATGTGKTRIAIALVRRLMQAGWCRRVLFLCDRRELRKQALNAFKAFLPGEPRVVIDGSLDATARAQGRVFLATYPAMLQCYQGFDAGFFDLVIADESHRSIYNFYRDLFLWFDARQLALTATPVKFIHRNTYQLFGCEEREPTAAFTLDEAVAHTPPYLVPPKPVRVETRFQREGIRYAELTEEQQKELEDALDQAEEFEATPADIDAKVFNVDTSRKVLENLMLHGLRDATGSLPGKSIVFARSHDHAVHLMKVFRECYPDLGGEFCRVIDNQEREAEHLIDCFKDPKHPLRVAISVDMLDTGVDIPEVVNLVFSKPVRSSVKFWQMIGRGTRLCLDLFGPGQHKTHFLVFDHWGNFEHFSKNVEEAEPATPKSLLQQLFEARLDLATLAAEKGNPEVFQYAIDRVAEDLAALDACKSLAVVDRRTELLALAATDVLTQFAGETRTRLRSIAGPLMQWRTLGKDADAYTFDLHVTLAQCELLRGGAGLQNQRDRITGSVARLLPNHPAVKAKAEDVARVQSKPFWEKVTVAELEAVRAALRGVMAHQIEVTPTKHAPLVIDVTDGDVQRQELPFNLEGLDLALYRQNVQAVLLRHFADDPVLRKIRHGERVSDEDLHALCDLVLEIDDKANIYNLQGRDPATRRSLLATLRSLVGLDATAVDAAFTALLAKHGFSAKKMQFLALVKQHIVQHGGITPDKLYEAPFTHFNQAGVDGVFNEAEVDEILALVKPFDLTRHAS